jgi:hypothetical protein
LFLLCSLQPRLLLSNRDMSTFVTDESKEHRDKIDALSLQLSRASTLVEHYPDATAVHAHFEGRELYDPRATWTPEEESKVKLKTDIRLLGWLSIMFFGKMSHLLSLSNR